MNRIHLFELGDQSWWPKFLRDAMTAYLTTVSETMGMMEPLLPKLTEAIERSEASQIVDLCSGAGGPAMFMARALEKSDIPLPIVCSDLYPNHEALHAVTDNPLPITFRTEPTDATAMPEDLVGLRTMFNAFHHFRPESARKVLKDAHDKNQPIAIFEVVDRGFANLVGLPLLPLMVMALMPRCRPFHWLWIPFTYLIPIIPLAILWDGGVSALRIYHPEELEELVEGLDGFDWDIGRIPLPMGPIYATYLVGVPKR